MAYVMFIGYRRKPYLADGSEDEGGDLDVTSPHQGHSEVGDVSKGLLSQGMHNLPKFTTWPDLTIIVFLGQRVSDARTTTA